MKSSASELGLSCDGLMIILLTDWFYFFYFPDVISAGQHHCRWGNVTSYKYCYCSYQWGNFFSFFFFFAFSSKFFRWFFILCIRFDLNRLLSNNNSCIFRACGQVFCSECSKQRIPLPQFGYMNPERVCENCFQHNSIRQVDEEVSYC